MYWMTGILGLLFAIAPFLLGYANNAAATWTGLVVGMVVMGASILERLAKDNDRWEYWTEVVGGLLAIAAPFVFGFSTHSTAMLTTIVLGGLITLFAGSMLSRDGFKQGYGL